jgi:ABC-type uncharacterized transport system auxiliary subunit
MRRALLALVALSALVGLTGCLSARSTPRSYFVLHGETREPVADEPLIRGLVRVRTLDTDAVYEKFQIVVRQSPYQLRYSETNVWAVKPDQLVADLVAQAMDTSQVFSAVTRELGDSRPDYTLSGKLHAIEVYDSEDLWFAHLKVSMSLSRFSDGERIWSMDFDQRKRVTTGDFGHAVRAISELLQVMLTQAIAETSGIKEAEGAPTEARPRPGVGPAPDDTLEEEPEDPHAPVMVPESAIRPAKGSDP